MSSSFSTCTWNWLIPFPCSTPDVEKFISLSNQPPRLTQPGHPSWIGAMSTGQRAVMLGGWEVKAGMARVRCQVKLCDPLYNTCHIWALYRCVCLNAVTQICINCNDIPLHVVDLGPDFWTILRQSYDFLTIYADVKTNLQYYCNRMNSRKIANIAKYINVNIKTSLFTPSREIMGKYVLICT